MRWSPRAFLLLALVGCGRIAFDPVRDDGRTSDGGGPGDEDGSHSGARLKIVWNEFSDGTRVRLGIFDSLREEACEIERRTNPARCAPRGLQYAFADASCLNPVGVVADYCALSDYVIDESLTERRHFLRGAPVAGNVYYTLDSTLTCNGPGAIPGGTQLYSVGPEVPRSEFAVVTSTREPSSGPLVRQFYETEDGLRVAALLHDTSIAADCFVSKGSGRSTACRPNDSIPTFNFADAACTQRVAVSPLMPRFADYIEPAGCPLIDFRFHSVANENTSGMTYVLAGMTCFMNAPPAGSRQWNLGPELQLVSLVETIETEAGRRIQHTRHAGGGIVARHRLYDTSTNEMCTVQKASDGVGRCLPEDPLPVDTFYEDAGCTVPIVLAYADEFGACAPLSTGYAIRATQNGACDTRRETFELGAVYTGPVYLPFNCMPRTTGVGITTTYYRVGLQIPPTAFAPATEVTDP